MNPSDSELRIGVDARLLNYRRGMGNFVYNLLHAWSRLPDKHSYRLYVDTPKTEQFAPDDARFSVRRLVPRAYPIWEHLSLPHAAKQDGLDILFCPANTAPLYLSPRVKLVQTVHDVMYLLPPELLPPSPARRQRLGRHYRRFVVPRAARRAQTLVTVSEHSRRDIARYIETGDTPVLVVPAAPNGACRQITDTPQLQHVCQRYGLKQPFVMALAAVDPRKNTARVIEAFSHFKRCTAGPCQLLLVGLNAAEERRPFVEMAHALAIDEHLVFTSFVPEEDMVVLFNAAQMLVYPSLYEGFGLPVLEAMICGTPVITSPRGSLSEVAGKACLMVDPLSVEAIAQALIRLYGNAGLRKSLVDLGRRQVENYSWRKSAAELLRIFSKTHNSAL